MLSSKRESVLIFASSLGTLLVLELYWTIRWYVYGLEIHTRASLWLGLSGNFYFPNSAQY